MGMQECLLAVREAAKGKLTPQELDAIEQRAAEIKKRVEAEGKLDGLNDRIRELTQQEADKIKIAAALQRKQAALNAIVRDRLQSHVEGLVAAGYSPSKAVLSVFEGTQQGVANARKSVYALRQSYETKYVVGGMLGELEKGHAHLQALVDDKDMGHDIVREMYELRQGGTPGKTGNADAQFVAKVFSAAAEMSRTDLNKRGAAIGKLDGWAGPQRHSDTKIGKVDADTWAKDTLGLLDVNRTFPDVATTKEATDILKDIRTTILTGQEAHGSAVGDGKRVGPANLAKSLGKSRVLHFKDADAWISYNEKYGDGGIFQAMIAHQQHAASAAAQLDTFGPTPQVMLASFLEAQQIKVRSDTSLTETERNAEIRRLDLGTGGIRGTAIASAFLDMRGMVSSPSSLTLAKIGQGIRNGVAMASLGGASITSVPSDLLTSAAAGMFRGNGFFNSFTRQLLGLVGGQSDDLRRLGFLLGEGADGFIGEAHSPYLAHDGVPGYLHKMATTFFKWNGLTWTTDRARSVHARMLSAEIGMHSKSAWADVNPRFRHVLEMQGFTPEKWEAVRAAAYTHINGTDYVTPDAARNIPDDKIEPLIASRMADLTTKDPARIEAARQRFLDDARSGLEMDLGRFFADETSYGVVETDAASRRVTTWGGMQSGTLAGELVRTIMQFKGFPIAFTQRVMGRAIYGGEGATKGERFMANLPHIGMLLAGLTAAGYLSVVGKDLAKGNWPPRNPIDPKVWGASALQGGALGIYGDFLFGAASRFGNSPLETLAGPGLGRAADIIGLYQSATHGDTRAGAALNVVLEDTPYANLFYVRPALDALFLNSMREWASPGYRRRQQRNLATQYGQHPIFGVP